MSLLIRSKIGDDDVVEEMVKKGIELSKAKEYLSYVKNLKPNEEIVFILKYLKNYGFPDDWHAFDSTIRALLLLLNGAYLGSRNSGGRIQYVRIGRRTIRWFSRNWREKI